MILICEKTLTMLMIIDGKAIVGPNSSRDKPSVFINATSMPSIDVPLIRPIAVFKPNSLCFSSNPGVKSLAAWCNTGRIRLRLSMLS